MYVKKVFFDKVMGLCSFISYVGNTVEELNKAFEEAIDIYL